MTRPLRIGHLLSSVSRSGGGVAEAVVSQALSLVERDFADVHVFGLEDEHTEADRSRWRGISLRTRKVVGPKRFGYAPGLLGDLLDADLDVLQTHGLWMYPSIVAPMWARRTGRRLVLSTHGMLDPWILGRGRVQKSVAMTLYELRNLNTVSLFHALTDEEARQIKAVKRDARCVVIPNVLNASQFHAPSRSRSAARRFMLYLGRLHEKKNVIRLLEAWHKVRAAMSAAGYGLKIAGWGDSPYVARVRARIDELALQSEVELLGPRFGAEKEALISCADFLLLPSLGEGLPMAIVEAWARGTPTAMSRFCNLSEAFAANAAVETGVSEDDISRCLVRLVHMDREAWEAMSSAAFSLARKRFHPDKVAAEWQAAYAMLASSARS